MPLAVTLYRFAALFLVFAFAPGLPHVVTTAEGATDFAIPLGYTEAAKVRFKVVDGEGNPVEAAMVGFRNGPERRLCAPTELSKTDAKGSAGAEVAVGKHEIVVRAKGYAIARAPFDTAELGAGVVEVTL